MTVINDGIKMSYEKGHVLLRCLQDKDAPLMYEWMQDPDITKYFRFDQNMTTMESIKQFIQDNQNTGKNIHFAIADAKSDEYYGTVSLKDIDYSARKAEYAIVLRRRWQGNGYGAAATVMILDYAFFTLNLKRVYLNVLADNINAIKLYQRLGFQYEGEFLDHLMTANGISSLKWYRIMKEEYEKIKR